MQVISSNPLASTVVFQTPVPGPSSSSGPSFSYNIAHKGAGFPGSQPFQSSTVRVIFLRNETISG